MRAQRATCTDAIDCQSACAAGVAEACSAVGDALSGPDGAKLIAASAYARACVGADDQRACGHLATLLQDKSDVVIAHDLAERLVRKLSQACESGDDAACSEGLDLAETWEIRPLADRLMGALDQRCDEGSAGACLEVLENTESSESAARLEQRIVELGRTRCMSGAETACMAMKGLADLHQRENATEEARRRTKIAKEGALLAAKIEELQMRCHALESAACIDLATLYLLNGMPVTARHTLNGACDAASAPLPSDVDAGVPTSAVASAGLLCWNAFLFARDFNTQSGGLDPFEMEPWQKLHAACAGGVQPACELQKSGALLGPSEPLAPVLVEATGKGTSLPFGVTRLVVEPGTGADVGMHDRVLVRLSWYATSGDPLGRTSSLAVVTADRGDALAEALHDTKLGAHLLARISPGPLSSYALPVTASIDVLAVVPHGPVRSP